MAYRRCLSSAIASSVILAASLAAPSSVRAQGTASINGTVTDASGALIPGADISVLSEATNAIRDVQTGETGTYTISNLAPGNYQVTFTKSGLKTVQFAAVTLTVDQALTLDATLEVSSTSQTVTVEGIDIAPIDTTDPQVSNVVDEKQIEALPLILRDPYQLVLRYRALHAGIPFRVLQCFQPSELPAAGQFHHGRSAFRAVQSRGWAQRWHNWREAVTVRNEAPLLMSLEGSAHRVRHQ